MNYHRIILAGCAMLALSTAACGSNGTASAGPGYQTESSFGVGQEEMDSRHRHRGPKIVRGHSDR